jgi:hypothetical protein
MGRNSGIEPQWNCPDIKSIYFILSNFNGNRDGELP